MSESIYTVRVGTPQDYFRMMDFMRLMHAENGVMPWDDEAVDNAVKCGLAHYHSIVGIIDGDNGDVAASVGLFMGRFWYTAKPHLEDHWLFVAEPYRRRPLARPLLEFAKRAADKMDTPLLMGVLSETRTAAKCRLYERQLGPSRGAAFLYEPGRQDHQQLAGMN